MIRGAGVVCGFVIVCGSMTLCVFVIRGTGQNTKVPVLCDFTLMTSPWPRT